MEKALIDTVNKIVRLSAEDVQLILSYFKPEKFKRNEVLVHSGSVAKNVYFVVKGLLQQYYVDENGNEKTCDFTLEHKFVTDLESFTRKIPSSSSIRALKPTSCMVITCANLMKLVGESKAVQNFFNTVVEHIASESMRRTKSLLTHSPEQRFNELLEEQPDIFQKVPQRYIAQYLGVAPESLSRIKKRMMPMPKS